MSQADSFTIYLSTLGLNECRDDWTNTTLRTVRSHCLLLIEQLKGSYHQIAAAVRLIILVPKELDDSAIGETRQALPSPTRYGRGIVTFEVSRDDVVSIVATQERQLKTAAAGVPTYPMHAFVLYAHIQATNLDGEEYRSLCSTVPRVKGLVVDLLSRRKLVSDPLKVVSIGGVPTYAEIPGNEWKDGGPQIRVTLPTLPAIPFLSFEVVNLHEAVSGRGNVSSRSSALMAATQYGMEARRVHHVATFDRTPKMIEALRLQAIRTPRNVYHPMHAHRTLGYYSNVSVDELSLNPNLLGYNETFAIVKDLYPKGNTHILICTFLCPCIPLI